MSVFKHIKRIVRKIIVGHDVDTYFFSQGGEDAMLLAIFRQRLLRKQYGCYIDVGANHPTRGSNTHMLYINGWSGVNIDASPGSMTEFKKVRKRDKNLEIGVGPEKGEMDFYYFGKNSPINTFDKDYVDRNGFMDRVKQVYKVPVIPLADLIKEYVRQDREIDLLNVDVEGFDLEVLKSNDWSLYRPKVVIVEVEAHSIDDLYDNNICAFMKSKGYLMIAKNVIRSGIASVLFAREGFKF